MNPSFASKLDGQELLNLELEDHTQIICSLGSGDLGNYVEVRIRNTGSEDISEYINYGQPDDKFNSSDEVIEAVKSCKTAKELSNLIYSSEYLNYYDLTDGLIEVDGETDENDNFIYPIRLYIDSFYENSDTITTIFEVTKEQYWLFHSLVNIEMTPEQVIEKLNEMGLSALES